MILFKFQKTIYLEKVPYKSFVIVCWPALHSDFRGPHRHWHKETKKKIKFDATNVSWFNKICGHRVFVSRNQYFDIFQNHDATDKDFFRLNPYFYIGFHQMLFLKIEIFIHVIRICNNWNRSFGFSTPNQLVFVFCGVDINHRWFRCILKPIEITELKLHIILSALFMTRCDIEIGFVMILHIFQKVTKGISKCNTV